MPRLVNYVLFICYTISIGCDPLSVCVCHVYALGLDDIDRCVLVVRLSHLLLARTGRLLK